jgi:hypothetical protein
MLREDLLDLSGTIRVTPGKMVVNGGYLVEKHPKNAEESHKMALANLICSRTTMKIGLGSFDDLDT